MTMALALAADNPSRPTTTAPADAVIPICEVVSIERQEVPGADPGVLAEMFVKEGMKVTMGMELARIDDREVKAQLIVKQLELDVADQEAKSEIKVRYEQATANVAQAALQKLEDANKGATGAVSAIEVLRTKLERDRAKLGIEKAREELVASGLTAQAKKAEVDAAQVVVARRVLTAPFDGVVLKVSKHVGEWVPLGDPVVEVVRVDRLSIRGGLEASEWARNDIEGRDVTVEVQLPRGRVEKVPGKVVFVSPVVDANKLHVWAEIDTPMDKDGRPIIPAGLTAKMTIHVNPPPKTDARGATLRAALRVIRRQLILPAIILPERQHPRNRTRARPCPGTVARPLLQV
jgi:multidrug efflux pump subunit AcrA (membrane-fusion protein)